jgi:hypothetical protein
MVGLLCFVPEEKNPWQVYYILLQKKGTHGRSTMFCYRRKGSMVGLLCFATEEKDPW